MASLVPYSDPRLRKPNLLKDYLLDDFSSCSSNGFRSFPRRQCCTTTVRIFLDRDLAKKKHKNYQIPPTQKSSPPSKTMLQRASTAVYKAVKKLPFSSTVKPRRAILPRSISRKLFKRSFWKKSDRKEIERWNTFHTVVENKSEPSLYSPVKTNTVITNSKSKKSYGSCVSWTESEFTSSSSCSSGNSGTVNSSENEVVKNSEQVVKMGKRVGVIVGEAITSSHANCVVDSPKQKQWPNQENKEQFSPVSVLDCPFDNDDVVEEEDEVSSAFKHKRAPAVEGTNHKLKKNLRRLESLSKLEPVVLEKRIALAESDGESVGSPLVSIQENFVSDNEEEYNISGKKSEELLEQMKARTPATSLVLNSDNLFLDFFIEATYEDNKVSDCELLDLAKDWINGQPQEMMLGWEVKKNREVYIREMEKGGMWSKLDEDRQEVALELEAEIFTSLVNDLFR
ncbi:Lateral signaling target protein [Heracleum sosnowskyi]|uniref:Lateral signaling target protein n=1 Tax=Heracleum sosnowskyi TaxID=360622 RepID=A0AAD8HVV5_9APIA|nr:Lateral signaling target protein [Heracleum sosnowskyi]